MKIIETNFKYGTMNNRAKTTRIILHHAGASKCSTNDIHNWHLNNGWAGAGYHFLVRKDGSIYRMRPENKVGSHAYGANSDSLGICAEGNFETETMSSKQMNSIIELVSHLKKKYGISIVKGHRDVGSTSCPGKNYPFTKIVNGAKGSASSTSSKSSGNSTIKKIQNGYIISYKVKT